MRLNANWERADRHVHLGIQLILAERRQGSRPREQSVRGHQVQNGKQV